jgi:hypothetical protein
VKGAWIAMAAVWQLKRRQKAQSFQIPGTFQSLVLRPGEQVIGEHWSVYGHVLERVNVPETEPVQEPEEKSISAVESAGPVEKILSAEPGVVEPMLESIPEEKIVEVPPVLVEEVKQEEVLPVVAEVAIVSGSEVVQESQPEGEVSAGESILPEVVPPVEEPVEVSGEGVTPKRRLHPRK